MSENLILHCSKTKMGNNIEINFQLFLIWIIIEKIKYFIKIRVKLYKKKYVSGYCLLFFSNNFVKNIIKQDLSNSVVFNLYLFAAVNVHTS